MPKRRQPCWRPAVRFPSVKNAAQGRPLRRIVLHWAALGGNPAVVRDVLRAVAEDGIAAAGGGNGVDAEHVGAVENTANDARAEALEAFSLSKPGGPDGTTPLHLAAEGGHTSVAVTLLRFGARIGPVDALERIPLTICLDKGHDEMALELVRRSRRNVNIPVGPPDDPALHYAALKGCLPVVELLLAKGASINVPTHFYETPLHPAATCGPNAGKVINRLLAAGFKVDVDDVHHTTPLFHAVKYSDHHPGPAIRALMAAGANPHDPCSGFSPVQQAALDDKVDALSVLLELGVDPDTRYRLDDKECGGASLLSLAARRLSVGAVELLLSAGANDGITATGLPHVLIELGQYDTETTVPADDIGEWADQVTPTLSKAEYERRAAAILSMLARAKFFRKDWLSVVRARGDTGASLTGAGSDNGGPPQVRRKTAPRAESPSSSSSAAAAAAAMDRNGVASNGDGVVAVAHDSVWYQACV